MGGAIGALARATPRVLLAILSCATPRPRAPRGERSRRLNPVTVPAEVVGSSIGRLSHHRMMSGDGCDGLELIRRPYNGRGIHEIGSSTPLSTFGVGWLHGVNGVVHSSGVTFLSVP